MNKSSDNLNEKEIDDLKYFAQILGNIKLDGNSSKSSQIYALLRQAIIWAKLQPGSPINEKALAKSLGVSRTPVREAIISLCNEDLIDIFPHSGIFVTNVSRGMFVEGAIIRKQLEIAGVRHAAQHATVTQIEDLYTLHYKAERLAKREAWNEYVAVDDALHHEISKISGFKKLWRMIREAKAHVDRLRHLAAPIPGHLGNVQEQHLKVIEAIELGDPDKAEAAMVAHLDYSHEMMKELIEEKFSTIDD
ncbi:GntR family transcriptional regulator [Ruegeria hyattellae]|uniref:GntR family transcriptional regulator n=1 Tax=Ruegeria hyattellae TaxID=3233337 RepID=UPI00355B81BB